jgi:hypothetical protein
MYRKKRSELLFYELMNQNYFSSQFKQFDHTKLRQLTTATKSTDYTIRHPTIASQYNKTLKNTTARLNNYLAGLCLQRNMGQ